MAGWVGLVASLGLVGLVAFGGSRFRPSDWYYALAKPSWNPPAFVFAPVWTLLYILMAIAAWLVWARAGSSAGGPLVLYLVQLALNVTWSWLFFGRHHIGLALLDLVALWAVLLVTTILFWQIRVLAGVLLVPYLAWVSFAGALNFSIWRLNRRS